MSAFARRFLRGAEWRDLSDTLSPALFDVVPPAALASTASALMRARIDRLGQRRALQDRAARLQARGLPVQIAGSVNEREQPVSEAARRARGDALLRLYFHQLINGSSAFLDLRSTRFSGTELPLRWSPGWMRYEWAADFQTAVFDMYAGFYQDDISRFDRALGPLGIRSARAVFLDHFGGEDQRAVRFHAEHFRETFHRAFLACRDAGEALHPDFLPLGVMLATLYAHLEPLDVALDVRAAWNDAAGQAGAR